MHKLKLWVRRLRQDRQGVAAIEVGLTLPILIFVFAAGFEIANYSLARMKVARVATMLADLTAQSPVGVHESQISDLFLSANLVTAPIEILKDGRIYLTAIRGGGDKVGNTILWQRCDGQQTKFASKIGSSNNKFVTLPRNTVLPNDAVTITAQATLKYEPLIFIGIFPNTPITHVATYSPRSLSFGVITADGSQAKSNCGTNVTQYDSNGNAIA